MTTSFGFERPPLVLVATHEEWAGRSIDSILRPDEYAVVRASSGRHAIQLARATEPDAIILEMHMPNLGGLDVCHLLHDDLRFRTTPIILTTDEAVTRSERLAAFAAGAWACLGTPLDSELLLTQLRNFVRSKMACAESQSESLLDERTGLYSLKGLRCRLKEMAGEARRARTPLACIAFGPDDEEEPGRKDRAPRGLPERAVVQLAHVLQHEARCSDVLGRAGRTEVAVVAPATTEPGALRLIERYREIVASAPLEVDGVARPVQLRAGYVAADLGSSRLEGSELLLQAMAALRQARQPSGGRPVMSFADTARPH